MRKAAEEDVPSRKLKAHVTRVKRNAEAEAILEAVEQTDWSRREAARILQVSYRSLLGKLHRYGLDSSEQEELAPWRNTVR